MSYTVLGIEDLAVNKEKISKTSCLHRVYILVHAVSTVLCLLDPDTRRIFSLVQAPLSHGILQELGDCNPCYVDRASLGLL